MKYLTLPCGQTVTGRQLTYEKALKIVQKEVYLNSVSIDNVPKHRKKRQLGVIFMDFFGGASLPSFCAQLATSNVNTLAINNCNGGCNFILPVGCSGRNFYTGLSSTYFALNQCVDDLTSTATSICSTTTTTTTTTSTLSTTTVGLFEEYVKY